MSFSLKQRYTYIKTLPQNRGQAMLIAVIFFLFISFTIVMGIATPILQQVKNSIDLFHSKQTLYVAEGGLEDALYRLKTNKAIDTGDTVLLEGYSSHITLTNAYNSRVVDSESNINGLMRTMEAEVIAGVGVSFNYGVQTGNGGFILANSSGVQGNVYANGDILGSNNAYITGSAIAADSASLFGDQSNGGSASPPNSITFRDTSTTQDVAQQFEVSTTSPVNKILVYIKKTGNPGNASVRIVNDNAGAPGSIVIDSATLGDSSGASAITTSYGWVTATFTNNSQLNINTPYWLIIENGGSYSSSNYYTIGADGNYASGTAKIGRYSVGSWNDTSPADLDIYFQVFLGGLLGTINNVDVGVASGDAWAHTVTNTVANGNLYCQTGSGNNKSCDTSRVDPSPRGYPISDANIQQWKNDAAAGGTYSGNYTVDSSVSLGPKKIEGNLIINGTLTLTGTLWVTGTISGANGSHVQLASGYGLTSGVIVADGYIDLSNNMQFSGVPGHGDTYILLLTTSACPNTAPCAPNSSAIYLANNAGAVILNAQSGKLHLKNGASMNSAVAYQIELDPNAIVQYVTGLADMNFTSGPSGGWDIKRWQEVE